MTNKWVKFIGEDKDELGVFRGCVYACLGIERDSYRIVDGCGDDYLYWRSQFEDANRPESRQNGVWYEQDDGVYMDVCREYGIVPVG